MPVSEATEEFTTKQTEKTVPLLPEATAILEQLTADYANVGRGQYGATMFVKNLRKYLRNTVIVDKLWKDVQRSWNTLHGVRTITLGRTRGKTSNTTLARRFYERLSTSGLKKQCVAFDIDYNSFEDQEDIIKALVTKHVELMST